ncbi:MAG: TlpA family protein disulfide reductase [Thermoguttaceae bacterium]
MKKVQYLLSMLFLLAFVATGITVQSVSAQEEPKFDEAAFKVPEDKSIDELLELVQKNKQTPVVPYDRSNRSEVFAYFARLSQMELEICEIMLAKKPTDEQLGQTLGIARGALNVLKQVTNKENKVYISNLEKIEKEIEKILENAPSAEAKLLAVATKIELAIDKGDFEKATELIDQTLAQTEANEEKVGLLMLKLRVLQEANMDLSKINADFFTQYEKIVEEIEKADPNLLVPRFGFSMAKINWLADNKGKIEDVKPLLDFAKNFVEKNTRMARVITQLEMPLTKIGENSGEPDYYSTVLDEFKKAYLESGNPDLAKAAAQIDGARRFAKLVGNEMPIKGYLLNGEKFDWEKYKDKVVLIDFWATWCGPCLGEIPNMKANWEKYHKDGFEIIGIAVWDKTDIVKDFVEKEGTPWTIMDDQQGIEAGDESLAAYYGVTGIPTMVLIGRDGKVISTRARGAELNKLLEEQFSK